MCAEGERRDKLYLRNKKKMFRRHQEEAYQTHRCKLNGRQVTRSRFDIKVWRMVDARKSAERAMGEKKKERREDTEKESERMLQEREIHKFSRRGKTWLRNLEASVKRIVPAEED